MAFSFSKTESTVSEINVVPLVDIMLVLLIIFMITAPMIQRGVDVNVPKTKSGTAIPQERLILTITKESKIYAMDDNPEAAVGVDQVAEVVDRYFVRHPVAADERTIYVRADGDVAYSTLMLVIDAAKAAGVERVGLVTDPATSSDRKKEETSER